LSSLGRFFFSTPRVARWPPHVDIGGHKPRPEVKSEAQRVVREFMSVMALALGYSENAKVDHLTPAVGRGAERDAEQRQVMAVRPVDDRPLPGGTIARQVRITFTANTGMARRPAVRPADHRRVRLTSLRLPVGIDDAAGRRRPFEFPAASRNGGSASTTYDVDWTMPGPAPAR
jgi:hypothetical protein